MHFIAVCDTKFFLASEAFAHGALEPGRPAERWAASVHSALLRTKHVRDPYRYCSTPTYRPA